MLIGKGAEDLAKTNGIPTVSQDTLITEKRINRLEKFKLKRAEEAGKDVCSENSHQNR